MSKYEFCNGGHCRSMQGKNTIVIPWSMVVHVLLLYRAFERLACSLRCHFTIALVLSGRPPMSGVLGPVVVAIVPTILYVACECVWPFRAFCVLGVFSVMRSCSLLFVS